MRATPSSPAPADVLVVGAGPAALALACALADAGLQVDVFEQQALAALEAPADDGREIALTYRSRRLMTELGLWSRLPAQAIAPLHEARVLDGDGRQQPLRFTPRPGTDGPLGWLVANRHIRAAAFAAASSRAQVRVHGGAQVASLHLDAQRAGVRLADGRRFDAALVVAADSRFSPTRRLAGIGASMRDFGRSVILACVEHERPHDGIAWECFRYGNTLALLPMSGQRSSVVLTVASDAAPEWLDLPDAEFAARVEAQAAHRLGRLALVGARHHYPLVGVHAQRFVARRFALIGDAAVGMHPVTAQGWNLGLHGVEALARELAAARRAGRDLGDPAALQAFERAHWRRTWPLYAGTNAVVSLFTDDRPLARMARRLVMDASEQMPLFSGLVKRFVARQLTEGGATRVREPRPTPRELLP
ncbi:5-demethoxyubiquinol-8 5-hydroxylase UbiM [Caldimonas sp. KR1-144]|uniref:5-demethoxyubiquinol-8 5-hydroxylase UbiM n=1 Tax=Caldimonas sp. KR1-144 TaxID=3400911 RepID=UPI003C0DD80A